MNKKRYLIGVKDKNPIRSKDQPKPMWVGGLKMWLTPRYAMSNYKTALFYAEKLERKTGQAVYVYDTVGNMETAIFE